jgi:outer membrane biosynthesis protein TonB
VRDAPRVEPGDLNLLRSWSEPVSKRSLARDVIGSFLVHTVIILFVLFSPEVTVYTNGSRVVSNFKEPTRLIYPQSRELTQKAPNQGKVVKQLDSRSAVQAQPAQAPHVRQFAPPPPGLAGKPAPLPAPQIESPQIQAGPLTAQIPSTGEGTTALNPFQAPRPAPVAAPKPPAPKPPDVIRQALRPGGQGPTVGDIAEDSPRVQGVAPSPCNDCSALQLLSDPKNVDFKPYLLQVLALVKKNWMAVIPDSARLGRKGVVVLRFIIDRHGAVPNLEITSQTPNDFNQASIAGISASVPFPALPAEYQGDQIHLQMAFAYNVTSH